MLSQTTSFLTCAVALLAALPTTLAATSPDGVFDGGKGAASKIDYHPAFTFPQGGEIWKAGQRYSASWDQTLPQDIAIQNVSHTADIMLGYKSDVEGDYSEHLKWTLAKDVQLYAPAPNSVDFELPADLVSRDSYFLVMLGSTSDTSALFSIVGHASSPTATESASAPAATAKHTGASPVAANVRQFVKRIRGASSPSEK
ncbi:hypothetical protein JCM8202_001096 [Rhodotorula sphaerocarpa]